MTSLRHVRQQTPSVERKGEHSARRQQLTLRRQTEDLSAPLPGAWRFHASLRNLSVDIVPSVKILNQHSSPTLTKKVGSDNQKATYIETKLSGTQWKSEESGGTQRKGQRAWLRQGPKQTLNPQRRRARPSPTNHLNPKIAKDYHLSTRLFSHPYVQLSDWMRPQNHSPAPVSRRQQRGRRIATGILTEEKYLGLEHRKPQQKQSAPSGKE